MKIISILFIIFAFYFGKPVKQINATMQEWVGGIGSAKGINYTVTFIARKSSDKIIPIKANLNNTKNLRFIILKNNKKLSNNFKFNKGDTLVLKCSYTKNLKQKNTSKQKINTQKLYITFEYKKSKKTKTIEVTKFKKLKTLMYP